MPQCWRVLCSRLLRCTFRPGESLRERQIKAVLVFLSVTCCLIGCVIAVFFGVPPRDTLALCGWLLVVTGLGCLVLLFGTPVRGMPLLAVALALMAAALVLGDLTQAASMDVRLWPGALLLPQVCMLADVAASGQAVVLALTLGWLGAERAESSIRYGLYSLSHVYDFSDDDLLHSRGHTGKGAAICNCGDPPCQLTEERAAIGFAWMAAVLCIITFLMQHYAKIMNGQHDMLMATIRVCEDLTDLLGQYEIDQAKTVLGSEAAGEMPVGLFDAFARLAANLESYKVYLPQSCLYAAEEDGEDETETDSTGCQTGTGSAGGRRSAPTAVLVVPAPTVAPPGTTAFARPSRRPRASVFAQFIEDAENMGSFRTARTRRSGAGSLSVVRSQTLSDTGSSVIDSHERSSPFLVSPTHRGSVSPREASKGNVLKGRGTPPPISLTGSRRRSSAAASDVRRQPGRRSSGTAGSLRGAESPFQSPADDVMMPFSPTAMQVASPTRRLRRRSDSASQPASPTRILGQRVSVKHVTLLCSNRCAFLSAVADLPVATLAPWIAGEVELFANAVAQNKGVVELFLADHTCSSFGASRRCAVSRVAAVRCADSATRQANSVRARGASRTFSNPRYSISEAQKSDAESTTAPTRGGPQRAIYTAPAGGAAPPAVDCPVTTAVCHGRATCGDFGSDSMRRYMIIGGVSSAVLLCDRIAARWRVRVLCDHATRTDLSDSWEVRLLASVTYAKRGSPEPLHLWEVFAESTKNVGASNGAAEPTECQEWMYSFDQAPGRWERYNEAALVYAKGNPESAAGMATSALAAADDGDSELRQYLENMRRRIEAGERWPLAARDLELRTTDAPSPTGMTPPNKGYTPVFPPSSSRPVTVLNTPKQEAGDTPGTPSDAAPVYRTLPPAAVLRTPEHGARPQEQLPESKDTV